MTRLAYPSLYGSELNILDIVGPSTSPPVRVDLNLTPHGRIADRLL
jgi:hypothetical protein